MLRLYDSAVHSALVVYAPSVAKRASPVSALVLATVLEGGAAVGVQWYLDDDATMMVAHAATAGGGWGAAVAAVAYPALLPYDADALPRRLVRSVVAVFVARGAYALSRAEPDAERETLVAAAVYWWLGYFHLDAPSHLACAAALVVAATHAAPLAGCALGAYAAWRTRGRLLPTLTVVITCGCSWFFDVAAWLAFVALVAACAYSQTVDGPTALMALVWYGGSGRHDRVSVRPVHVAASAACFASLALARAVIEGAAACGASPSEHMRNSLVC